MSTFARRFLAQLRISVAAHLRSHEDGITAAIFAVALIVLLGMVAVGIDGSRIYDERRQAQNAADHAALAAALASCTVDAAAAEAAGLDSAELNGYDDVPATEVEIDPSAAGAAHEFLATIDTEIPTFFAQVIGFSELNTTVTATARATGCEPVGDGVPALFGGGDCAFEKDIDISGEFHVVKGLTHTNGDFYNGGSKSQFTNHPNLPAVTYVDDFEGKKPDQNIYVKPEEQVAVQPWPPGYDPAVNMNNTMWNAYKAARINNLATLNPTPSNFNITQSGIYYTEFNGEVTIGTIAPNVSFTIVSKFGPVRLGNTHNGEWAAFPNNPPNTPDDIMVVSGYGSTFGPTSSDHCAQMAFLRSGEGGTWRGIFWAPHAGIEWSGNLGTVHGGLIGYSIKLNGNQHNIHGGSGTAAAVPDVFLTE